MNQKCRYCAHCIYGDVAYCGIKERTMTERSAKRGNKCRYFDFVPVDVFGDKDYQPKIKDKAKSEYEQLEMLEKEKPDG